MTEKIRCQICGEELQEEVIATKKGKLVCPSCFVEYLRRKKEARMSIPDLPLDPPEIEPIDEEDYWAYGDELYDRYIDNKLEEKEEIHGDH